MKIIIEVTKTNYKKLERFLLIVIFFGIIFSIILLGYSKISLYKTYNEIPDSALAYYLEERDFIEKYVQDKENGGFFYWVDRDGSIRDDKKYSVFQANVILWFGGLESQYHNEKNIELIKNAADYLIAYLYKGQGFWYEYDNNDHNTRQEFFWNPRNESYIAFALFQAYNVTGIEIYKEIAVETTKAQRESYPDARIMSNWPPVEDIGFKFPEHMGHYMEYLITGNLNALKYVRLYDETYRGDYAKEYTTDDKSFFYYHGMSTIDKLLYGYLDNNEAAYEEGSEARNSYWLTPHSDDKKFNTKIPGESSDNGRDYYDKRIAMDLIEWSKREQDIYRDDAITTWEHIKRFWDIQKPGGFFINSNTLRKTCFSIGMPQFLMDLTSPEIVKWKDEQKSIWNHQVTVTVRDPNYNWNNITLKGIGVDETKDIKLKIPFGFKYGQATAFDGESECEGCVIFKFNYFALLSKIGSFESQDFFGNHEPRQIKLTSKFTLSTWQSLNYLSKLFYSILFTILIIGIAIPTYIFKLLPLKNLWEKKHRKKS